MDLFRDGETEHDERWFKYADDPETGEPVEFLLRRLTADEALTIERRTLGSAKMKYAPNGGYIGDRAKTQKFRLARAAAVLRDSRGGASVTVLDAGAAEFYERQLNNGAVAPGQRVVLDGHWTDPIRERVTREAQNLTSWVLDRHAEMTAEAEDEEGKGE